jgi:transposase
MVKKTLSSTSRSLIIRLRRQKLYTNNRLAKLFHCTRKTIYNISKLHRTSHSIQPRPRSGRPKKLTLHLQNVLRAQLRSTPSATNSELISYLKHHHNIIISLSTIKRERRRINFHPVEEIIDMEMNEEHKHKRIQYALNNKLTNWKLVIFSDEKPFTLQGTRNRVWVEIGAPIPRRNVTQKKYSCMVWAAVWYQGRTTLSITTGGIGSKRYCEILGEHLLPVYPNQRFKLLQDNAKAHIAKNTIDWCKEYGITLLPDYPPYSPELNPIELVWSRMTQLVNGQSPTSPEELHNAIEHAWNDISQSYIQSLIDRLPSVLTKITENNGKRI